MLSFVRQRGVKFPGIFTDRLLKTIQCHFGSVSSSDYAISLLGGPIFPVVNLEMSSTARFFVEMQYMGAED